MTLTENVSFLSIPGVIVAPLYPSSPSPNAWIHPSPAQIASSISLVFSIGSIITGLLLIRRNRTMMTKDPKSAVSSNPPTSHILSWLKLTFSGTTYMRWSGPLLVLNRWPSLSVWPTVCWCGRMLLFVLIYSSALWIVLICFNSVCSFFVALLIFSFQDTSKGIWIPVGTAAGVIVISTIWCLENTWDQEEQQE